MILHCLEANLGKCKNAYQDALYGPGMRVANPMKKDSAGHIASYRCTVCQTAITPTRVERQKLGLKDAKGSLIDPVEEKKLDAKKSDAKGSVAIALPKDVKRKGKSK